MTARQFWRAFAMLWAIAAVLLVAVAIPSIIHWRFPDPDDQMRLIEVRDWLGGQSWFDVTQYRLNAPAGVPMHWSRLVDLPIAAVILAGRPIFGTNGAEQLALIAVPLLTLGVALAALASLSRLLLRDGEQALMAVCVALLSVEVVHQFMPMRIDHHGWQMACAVIAARALIGGAGWRAGSIAGIAIAIWLSISLEGLPLVAGIVVFAALRWVMIPQRRALLVTTVIVAAGGGALIFATTHAVSAWPSSVCDAVSPVYLAMLAVAAIGLTLVTAMPIASRWGRLAAVAVLGCAALLPLPLIAPQCARGPFGHLDPLVRHFWYRNVMEGLPLWVQSPATIVNVVAIPLIGLAGAAIAVRESEGEVRERWFAMLVLLGTATLAAIVTQRSGGVANLLAAPGVVRLLFPLLQKARAIGRAPRRIAATLGIFLLAAPGLAASVALEAIVPDRPADVRVRKGLRCVEVNDMRALDRLPRGDVLAPLDIAPTILLFTPLSAVASGHHRGAAAMHDVIAAFTGSDARAHAIVRARRLDYVAFCPQLAEIQIYESESPSGFLAHLDSGRVPDWLVPVPIRDSPVKVWRVR